MCLGYYYLGAGPWEMDLETSNGLKQKQPIEEHPCTVEQRCTDIGREDEVFPEQ